MQDPDVVWCSLRSLIKVLMIAFELLKVVTYVLFTPVFFFPLLFSFKWEANFFFLFKI